MYWSKLVFLRDENLSDNRTPIGVAIYGYPISKSLGVTRVFFVITAWLLFRLRTTSPCVPCRSTTTFSLAHFLSKDTIDTFNTLVKPVVYLSMFYFFSNPRSTFLSNYLVMLALVYCVTGMAYALAIFFHPGPAQLVRNNPLHVHNIFIPTQHCQWYLGLYIILFCFSHHLQWAVLLPVVMSLIANQPRDTLVMKILGQLCYPKWAQEAFVIANAER